MPNTIILDPEQPPRKSTANDKIADGPPDAFPNGFREAIPDAPDGLTRKERVILTLLDKTQKERGGRNVPTVMLYGRVLEHIDISQAEFQQILQKLVGIS